MRGGTTDKFIRFILKNNTIEFITFLAKLSTKIWGSADESHLKC